MSWLVVHMPSNRLVHAWRQMVCDHTKRHIDNKMHENFESRKLANNYLHQHTNPHTHTHTPAYTYIYIHTHTCQHIHKVPGWLCASALFTTFTLRAVFNSELQVRACRYISMCFILCIWPGREAACTGCYAGRAPLRLCISAWWCNVTNVCVCAWAYIQTGNREHNKASCAFWWENRLDMFYLAYQYMQLCIYVLVDTESVM